MPGDHSDLPNPCHAKLVRSSNYRDNCSNPCSMPTGKSPYKNQIHHILCEHAILDIQPLGDQDGKKARFIKDCLCTTKWDINVSDNLIGLPLKSVYIRSQGKTPQNFCCHNVDHNTADGYTNECKQWLHDNIWNTLVDQRKKHNVNAEAILDMLTQCIEHFTAELESRAIRPAGEGTQYAYENRFTEAGWYEPFSMAFNPTPRSPGGRGMPKILAMLG
jgi:hypothetical protein